MATLIDTQLTGTRAILPLLPDSDNKQERADALTILDVVAQHGKRFQLVKSRIKMMSGLSHRRTEAGLRFLRKHNYTDHVLVRKNGRAHGWVFAFNFSGKLEKPEWQVHYSQETDCRHYDRLAAKKRMRREKGCGRSPYRVREKLDANNVVCDLDGFSEVSPLSGTAACHAELPPRSPYNDELVLDNEKEPQTPSGEGAEANSFFVDPKHQLPVGFPNLIQDAEAFTSPEAKAETPVHPWLEAEAITTLARLQGQSMEHNIRWFAPGVFDVTTFRKALKATGNLHPGFALRAAEFSPETITLHALLGYNVGHKSAAWHQGKHLWALSPHEKFYLPLQHLASLRSLPLSAVSSFLKHTLPGLMLQAMLAPGRYVQMADARRVLRAIRRGRISANALIRAFAVTTKNLESRVESGSIYPLLARAEVKTVTAADFYAEALMRFKQDTTSWANYYRAEVGQLWNHRDSVATAEHMESLGRAAALWVESQDKGEAGAEWRASIFENPRVGELAQFMARSGASKALRRMDDTTNEMADLCNAQQMETELRKMVLPLAESDYRSLSIEGKMTISEWFQAYN